MRKTLSGVISALALLLSLAGCAALYKSDATSLELVRHDAEGSILKYKSVADMYYPINSTEAEKARIGWLEERLRENGYSTERYQILSRTSVVKLKTSNESTSHYDVYYEVKARR